MYEGGLGYGRTIVRDEYCRYDNPGVGSNRREEKHEERKEVVEKTEPVDYMAMTEAIKGSTNMTMLTQNQLNAGVSSRAPEKFPRPPANVFVPASTKHGTDRVPSTAANWMQVLWNSGALH